MHKPSFRIAPKADIPKIDDFSGLQLGDFAIDLLLRSVAKEIEDNEVRKQIPGASRRYVIGQAWTSVAMSAFTRDLPFDADQPPTLKDLRSQLSLTIRTNPRNFATLDCSSYRSDTSTEPVSIKAKLKPKAK